MGLLSTAILAAFALAQTPEPPASQPASAPASQPAEPEWVLSRTHFPPDVEDEKSYVEWCRNRRAELDAKANAATDPSAAARLRLAAVNVLLSLEIEPPVSRGLLQIAGPSEVETIRAGVREAQEKLKPVADGLPPSGGENEKTPGPKAAFDALSAFAAALSAIWGPSEDEESAEARQSAVAGLAVLLEDDRKEVAAAALLWQAVLYHVMDQKDRALQVLPTATERVAKEGRHWQFHARLLRCRLLAERGAHAATVALLLQVEEEALEWFSVDAQQQIAMNAAMLARLRVLESWPKALDPATQANEIAWCEKAIARLKIEAVAEGNPVELLGLEKVVPIVAPAPAD